MCDAMELLPEPAVPDKSTLLPRYRPLPSSMASSRAMPVDTRSVDASWLRPSDVIGITEKPFSSIKNGYSLVPCADPRYLTTRNRLVDTCSMTRWSSRMTQSETYSSRPCRVKAPAPRSAVIIAVTPRSLSQRKSRRSSERRTSSFGSAANSASIVSSTTRLALM